MLRSKTFRWYWEHISGAETYEEAILSHEARFTKYFTELGYKGESYIDCRKYRIHYPAILAIDEMMIDRCPLLKRRAFFHEPTFLEHYAGDLPRALRIIQQTSDYDRSLIWRNIVRSSELRTLNTNAALTSIFPDVPLRSDPAPVDYGRIAVCAHVYYTDMLDEILSLTANIPVAYDFIATTDTISKKMIIENRLAKEGRIDQVIVLVVEQNRGRDMSALFITCRDLFADDRYALVCRLHTKKTPR